MKTYYKMLEKDEPNCKTDLAAEVLFRSTSITSDQRTETRYFRPIAVKESKDGSVCGVTDDEHILEAKENALRDEFAKAALMGLMSKEWQEKNFARLAPQITEICYGMANAMLKERKKYL